ncbi:MAG: hypothetical protein HY815_09060 [Candidatus Riflebacteria bacterium]|nr:hypothetical protein [Candidatus Riflebacteria bacterium]
MSDSIHPASGATCPVCGDRLGDRFTSCPRCETPHHAECWAWAGGCAIYGCSDRSAVAIVPAAPSGALTEPDPSTPSGPAGPDDLSLQSLPIGDPRVDSGWLLVTPILPTAQPLYFGLATWGTWLGDLLWRLTVGTEGGINFVVSMMIPLPLFTQVRTVATFVPSLDRLEVVRTLLGRRLHRREIPFDEILRLEVWDYEKVLRLVLVLSDGTSFQIGCDASRIAESGQQAEARGVRRRLREVALGVRAHTRLHVTSALQLDPVTCRKRLESLKAAHRLCAGRLAILAVAPLVIAACLLVRMPAELVMIFFGIAFGVAALVLWATRPVAPARIEPQALLEFERSLHGRHPDRTGFLLSLAGYLAMVFPIILMPPKSPSIASVLSFLFLALPFLAYKWARAYLAGRALESTEVAVSSTEQELPPGKPPSAGLPASAP